MQSIISANSYPTLDTSLDIAIHVVKYLKFMYIKRVVLPRPYQIAAYSFLRFGLGFFAFSRRSLIGFFSVFGGALISWKTKKKARIQGMEVTVC